MFLKKSKWEFVTSSGGSVGVGFVSAGVGMYQIQDTTTGDIVQVDYIMAGPSASLTLKAIKEFFKVLKLPTFTGSSKKMFSAGQIIETHRSPPGSPLRMFTDGFFEVISADILDDFIGISGSILLWVSHDVKMFDIPITAFGLFTGLETSVSVPGAGASASLARVVTASIV